MYVDSGTGSMLISAVVAGGAGAAVVAKTQWRRISGAFKGKKDAGPVEGTATPGTDAEQQR